AISETHRSWKQVRWYVEKRVLPALGQLPVMEVRRRDCMKLLDRIGREPPVNRNRTKAWAGAMWRWALERDFPELEGLEYSPWATIKNLPEQPRTRVLSDAECRAVLTAETRMGPTTRDAILLALFT